MPSYKLGDFLNVESHEHLSYSQYSRCFLSGAEQPLETKIPAIGRQALTVDLDENVFCKEIAGARTFCLKEEAEMLLKLGFGKGANTKNTLVMDNNGPIDNVLRYPDEPVRHKILDLLGDLYLVGRPLEGRVIAIGSGHALNGELVSALRQKIEAFDSSDALEVAQ